MSSLFHNPPNSNQLPPAQSVAKDDRERGMDHDNWLLRLSGLPRRLYDEAVDRLFCGESVRSVAKWILSQPNRGTLGNITSAHTMRKYLAVLAAKVREQKRLHPAPTVEQARAAVPQVTLPVPVRWVVGRRYQTVEEYLADRCQVFNRQTYAAGVVVSCWEALERLRRAEEHMGEEKPIPLHAMAPGRVGIASVIIDALDFLRKNDLVELAKHKELGIDLTQLPVAVQGLVVQFVGQLMAKASELEQMSRSAGGDPKADAQRQALVSMAEKVVAMLRLAVSDPSVLETPTQVTEIGANHDGESAPSAVQNNS